VFSCCILLCVSYFFFFFKQKTAYEIRLSLVGSEMCIRDSDGIAVLLVEQNLSVACAVSDHVAIMTNGAISETIASNVLSTDSEVQARVLGFGMRNQDQSTVSKQREEKS